MYIPISNNEITVILMYKKYEKKKWKLFLGVRIKTKHPIAYVTIYGSSGVFCLLPLRHYHPVISHSHINVLHNCLYMCKTEL